MDIIFKCPHCEQELEVDETGAGSQIECPACAKSITVPEATEENVVSSTAAAPEEEAGGSEPNKAPALFKPDAAKPGAGPVLPPPKPAVPPPPPAPEKHLVVPVHDKPAEVLITKAAKPLEFAAKESDKRIRARTIRRCDCMEVGHDHFDEHVTAFLEKVGQPNIVSVTTINYSTQDLSTRQLINDYGVLIIFRG